MFCCVLDSHVHVYVLTFVYMSTYNNLIVSVYISMNWILFVVFRSIQVFFMNFFRNSIISLWWRKSVNENDKYSEASW